MNRPAILAVFGAQAAFAAPVLTPDSVVELEMDSPAFGGFSSLEVAADGMSFTATSDRGVLLQGDILRKNGRMVAVDNLELTPILDSTGVPLDGLNSDAEGLAIGPDGAIYMSFEGNHRIMRQPAAGALPEFVPKHPDFKNLINNSALEALAVDNDGVIYTIPERSGAEGRPFPVYRWLQTGWDKTWEIERRGEYLVTGADIFDNRLYVLERDLVGIFGFSSRVRRFELGDEPGPEELLITTRTRQFDNLEGISLWQTAGGQTRAVMISDDNFRFFQQSQLVEMVLEEAQ